MIDSWIYCTRAAWDALYHMGGESDPYPKADWVHPYATAVCGYWKLWNGTHEVFNVLGSSSTIDALVEELGAGVVRRFDWMQGLGRPRRQHNKTIPADVLDVMRDHILYNDIGEAIGSIPADMDNPNWGHVFFGQGGRVFAGDFNDSFGQDFR